MVVVVVVPRERFAPPLASSSLIRSGDLVSAKKKYFERVSVKNGSMTSVRYFTAEKTKLCMCVCVCVCVC